MPQNGVVRCTKLGRNHLENSHKIIPGGAGEIVGIRAIAEKPGQEERMGDARKAHEIWIE